MIKPQLCQAPIIQKWVHGKEVLVLSIDHNWSQAFSQYGLC